MLFKSIIEKRNKRLKLKELNRLREKKSDRRRKAKSLDPVLRNLIRNFEPFRDYEIEGKYEICLDKEYKYLIRAGNDMKYLCLIIKTQITTSKGHTASLRRMKQYNYENPSFPKNLIRDHSVLLEFFNSVYEHPEFNEKYRLSWVEARRLLNVMNEVQGFVSIDE